MDYFAHLFSHLTIVITYIIAYFIVPGNKENMLTYLKSKGFLENFLKRV